MFREAEEQFEYIWSAMKKQGRDVQELGKRMDRLDEKDRRLMSASGVLQREIARAFGVSRPTDGSAISGKTWGHVQ